jgi:hypothetical protein
VSHPRIVSEVEALLLALKTTPRARMQRVVLDDVALTTYICICKNERDYLLEVFGHIGNILSRRWFVCDVRMFRKFLGCGIDLCSSSTHDKIPIAKRDSKKGKYKQHS